jgi:pimeloyl-ACP methyl ester carboxylesterase
VSSVRRLEVGGVRLAVHTWQCPQPRQRDVVLLPGTGLTAGDWAEVAADLARDRTVHAVDLRGHGDSDWPGTYSVELMAHDVVSLLEGLAGSVDLVGHSLGGLVACRVAAANPRVHRLVLEDVGLMRPRTPTMPARPEGELDFDWDMVAQVRPEVDTPADDWSQVLAAIRAPVLAIGGGPTSFVPQQWVEDLVAAVPDAVMVTIAVGHEVHRGEPKAYVTTVRDHLDA